MGSSAWKSIALGSILSVLVARCPTATNAWVTPFLGSDRSKISCSRRYSTQSNARNSHNIAETFVNAEKLKEEAKRIRLEAEQLDTTLTLRKIDTIEKKLTKKEWLLRHPEEQSALERNLNELQKKLKANESLNKSIQTLSQPGSKTVMKEPSSSKKSETGSSSSIGSSSMSDSPLDNPISGFDERDLEIYLPVAKVIEQTMTNATSEEKLKVFRAAPELQSHFQMKLKEMIVDPLEEYQKIEDLKSQYLYSSSSVEKENLKREIIKLEKSLEMDGPFEYSDNVNLNISAMSQEEMNQRMEAVGALPSVLQALYKKRVKADDDADLSLAIELDHYELQIQLLDQIKFVEPISEELKDEARAALKTLPLSVRQHIASRDGVQNGENIEDLLESLVDEDDDDEQWGIFSNVVKEANADMLDLPEYNDIDFVDRSRYLEEFYPNVAKVEGQHPSLEDIDKFIAEIVDKKTFMVTSPPERVMGGYYIRGENLIDGDEFGNRLVERLRSSLSVSPMNTKMQLFYIPDPSPLTDEEVELGYDEQPLFLVVANNSTAFYNNVEVGTKFAISALGLSSAVLFSIACCEMRPLLGAGIETRSFDFELLKTAGSIALPILGISFAHELGHKIISWRDKFEIGPPTLIPSIQLGLFGAITPIKSPPPTLKSLFDFGMAGPLFGMTASIFCLIQGLVTTAAMDFHTSSPLPAVPVFLLKSSALGAGLLEFFLGKGVLLSGVTNESVLALDPLAIAGFVGLVVNALSLLPLGNTDGGRIALAMFGRRGTYVVKTFTAIILCAAGIFGLDDSRVLLMYVLYAFLWQRDLETPVANEVEELDFVRGAIAIGVAFFVALALLPFP